MRVLAHIHTLNDEAFIEQVLGGVMRQTRPPDAVVIVDNGSTDRTLDRPFPENVTVIPLATNQGTSGTIRVGFDYALQHQFDWTWVFDADSVPEPDALEKLLAFFQRLPAAEQERVCFLACRLVNAEAEVRHEPMTFTGPTVKRAPVAPDADHTECDYFTWTGSLFRMPAVARIGLPSADYVLDVAEVEYGFLAKRAGLKSYLIDDAVTQQDVGRPPGIVVSRVWSIGRWKLAFREASPIRVYYATRNHLYFWLHEYRPLQRRRVIRAMIHAVLAPVGFVLRPVSHRRQLVASLRGIWHGLTGQLTRRY